MIAGERITPSMSSQDVMAYRRLYVAGKLTCPTAIPHQEGRQLCLAGAHSVSGGHLSSRWDCATPEIARLSLIVDRP